MQRFRIKDFKKGWFFGNFKPALFQNKDVEVAHQFHPKGYVGPAHFHAIATEYNYIVRGAVALYQKYDGVTSGSCYIEGEGWVVNPGEYFETKFCEDTDLIVIKTPSVPGDWYSC